MDPKDLRDAIAARAAGEDLPGIDPGALEARLAADPALRAELEGLRGLCEALRGSPVPAARPAGEARRHRPVPAPRLPSMRRKVIGSRWWIAIAGAAALVLIAVLSRWMTREGEPPAPPLVAEGPPPAVTEALDALRDPFPPPRRTEGFRAGGGEGGGPAETSYLGPVLGQAGFEVRLPGEGDLPEGFELREARVRRAAVAGQDLVRIVWEGPTGRLVLVAAPAAPGVREALDRAGPPPGTIVRIVEGAGTVSLIGAAGIPGDRLETIAAGLR